MSKTNEEKKETKKRITKSKSNEKKDEIVVKSAERKKSSKSNIKKEKIENKENIKVEKLSLDKKSQKYLKIFSRIIMIITKIGKICLMILVPFIFLVMIFVPFIVRKIEVNGNIIKFDDVRMIINGNYVTLKVGDSNYISNEDIKELTDISQFIENNSIEKITFFLESVLLFSAFTLIVLIYIMTYIEKLFNNIYCNKTPFTEDNAKYIYNIGNLLCANALLYLIFSIIFEIAFPKMNITVGFKLYSVIEILGVFVLYYVFKYAINLQNKTNGEIYD